MAFSNRGIVKKKTGDLLSACSDWSKASVLGYETAERLHKKYCRQ